jgi:hypothetical protein
MKLTQITTGFTSITVMPSEIVPNGMGGQQSGSSVQVTRKNGGSTGARVTLEFTRAERLPPGREIRVRYDIAENGTCREFIGTPQLTHTTVLFDAFLYHYRISHWIAARSVK